MWNMIAILKRLKKLDKQKIFLAVVKSPEVQEFILNLNRVEQLFKEGKDAEGDIIGHYSRTTEQLSEGRTFTFNGITKQKKAGDPIFLYDQGDFYDSFTVRIDRTGVIIIANETTKDGTSLTASFGDSIIGLSVESLEKLANEILNRFIEETRKEIQKILQRY